MSAMTDRSGEAVIVDRGYRHFEGTRKGRRGAMGAVVRDGLRRVLGLRRKGRRKILPWTLITLALISVAILSALHYAANQVGITDLVADELPHNREYFEFISRIALLFVAFATPELLVPDREQGVLAVYLSRPLRTMDYLAAKGLSLGILILGFLLIPQTIFHLLLGVFSPDGFTTYMVDNLDVLWQVPAASLVYFLGYSSIALVLATLIPRVGFAAGIFLGVMIMFNGLAEYFVEFADFAGSEYGVLLAFESHPHLVRDWIFGASTSDYAVTRAGFEPWFALVTIVAVAVLAGALAWNRYRRLS
jgi:ABC-2 type transport system permease protein